VVYLKVLGLHIKEQLSNIFFKGDNYILIEILNHYVQVTVFKASPEQKKIRVIRNLVQPVPDFAAFPVLHATKNLLQKIRNLKKYKIILSFDSAFATTVHSSTSLVRSHQKEVIDEADLDNLISQAIWRFFDRNRLKVAQKMNIDDVDVILSDVRIRGIKLDGHRIVNPIGFKAKAVEIFFSQTFLTREIMRGIRDLLPKENVVLIVETGTAISHLLSRISGHGQFLVANLFPNQTAVYSAAGGRLAHLDNFEWGEENVHHSLYRHLRLDPEIAQSIVSRYSESDTSQNFLRRFENILLKELQIFANGLESLADSEVSEVYVNPFFHLPPIVFSDRFQNRFQKSLRLISLSTHFVTEKLGYEVQCKASAKVKNLATFLAAFSEVNFLPQNDKMSHLANRRVRWLVT
jgi:hypothetical protein